MKHPEVIAEIGCVHIGSMDRAKMLISKAKECGADFVKFQKRNPEESVPEDLKNKPHPKKEFAYGDTYLEHRKALEFTIDQHRELFDFCKITGINYSCSVWDMTSAKDIVLLNPKFIKIPSACNHNKNLIKYLFDNFSGDLHISTGMTSIDEKKNLIEYLDSFDSDRFVVYHCTSIYPCPFDKLNIMEISKLNKERYRVGFSNHGYGIATDIAAMCLGVQYIERHFVEDRSFPHTDAAASLSPEGLRKLCRDLRNVSCAMTFSTGEIDELEAIERRKLRME